MPLTKAQRYRQTVLIHILLAYIAKDEADNDTDTAVNQRRLTQTDCATKPKEERT